VPRESRRDTRQRAGIYRSPQSRFRSAPALHLVLPDIWPVHRH